MNYSELYDFSIKLNTFVRKARDLDVFHWFRYKYFVDNSKFPEPTDCKYVVRTATLGEEQSKLLYEELLSQRDLLNELIGVMENG